MAAPKPGQASLKILWSKGGAEEIPVQYNPSELQFEKQAQYVEINIPALEKMSKGEPTHVREFVDRMLTAYLQAFEKEAE